MDSSKIINLWPEFEVKEVGKGVSIIESWYRFKIRETYYLSPVTLQFSEPDKIDEDFKKQADLLRINIPVLTKEEAIQKFKLKDPSVIIQVKQMENARQRDATQTD